MLTEPPVGIVVALREELAAIGAHIKPIHFEQHDGVDYFVGDMRGVRVVAARSGMGRQRAQRLTELMLAQFGCRALVIAGYCGALNPAYGPGDIVQSSDPHSIVTLDRVVTTAADKRALAAQHLQAVAVDMETAGAVQAALTASIPWRVIRAVTDGLDDDLPLDFGRFTGADGETSRGRVVLHTLTHPWLIPALVQLGKRSQMAAANLATAVSDYVQSLGG